MKRVVTALTHNTTSPTPRVAIAHDYLNQRGGAERVALELARMWPGAPIYTTLYRPESTFPEFAEYEIHTSWVDRLPVDRQFRNLFFLYPSAIRSLGELDADLLVTSSSGWAHAVRTTGRTKHLVYCHTPARWLYRADKHLGRSSWQRRLAQPASGLLRRWDAAAAARADVYVANSENTRERIRAVYGIDAEVVYPPVDTRRFTPTERGDRFLVVSRLLDYKRVDAVVLAATAAGLPLDVVGVGPSLEQLQAAAGPTVTFHGRLPDGEVTRLMHECRAVVLPGEEDFGIVPVEAQAAGKPVVAYAAGGALETVTEGLTGTFFTSHDPGEVAAAMRRADDITTSPTDIAAEVDRFSKEAFAAQMRALADRVLGAPAHV